MLAPTIIRPSMPTSIRCATAAFTVGIYVIIFRWCMTNYCTHLPAMYACIYFSKQVRTKTHTAAEVSVLAPGNSDELSNLNIVMLIVSDSEHRHC